MAEEKLKTGSSNQTNACRGRALRWVQLCATGFVCVVMMVVMLCDWRPSSYPIYPVSEGSYPPSMNSTHIRGKLMETVTTNYTNNIFFTVKTSVKNYRKRLSLLMLTWFQVVDKNKLVVISDSLTAGQLYVNTIREVGFHLVLSNCSNMHSGKALCCKSVVEFRAYYDIVAKHDEGNENGYQWFCHADDDVYVNVPQLSKLLQQYDPREPYYIGKWAWVAHHNHSYSKLNGIRRHRIKNMNYTVKANTFKYATGSMYCLSQALMMKAKQFFNGKDKFYASCRLALFTDDIAIGLIVGVILGYNLTDVDNFHNQYDNIDGSSIAEISKYITVGYRMKHRGEAKVYYNTVPIESPFVKDLTKFMAYHCLLYPSVSWCPRQNMPF